MWGKVGVFWLILLICAPIVFSAETAPDANRFLSAELARQMQAQKEDMLKALEENQDANFQLLDNRMAELMAAERMKVVVGGMGAILAANAIVALLLLKYIRRYSYEKYLEDTLGRREAELEKVNAQNAEIAKLIVPQAQQQPVQNPYSQAFQEVQQPAWYPQQPQETVGMKFGQEKAAQMSQMNQWQLTPNYEGAWTPPVPVQREVAPWRPPGEG